MTSGDVEGAGDWTSWGGRLSTNELLGQNYGRKRGDRMFTQVMKEIRCVSPNAQSHMYLSFEILRYF